MQNLSFLHENLKRISPFVPRCLTYAYFCTPFMAEAVKLPKMSDTMTEGVIVKWNYKVGDSVKSGDVLAEVETDKATMDMEVYAKGTILYLVEEGSTAPVDGVIAVVGAAGEDFQSLLASAPSTPAANPAPETPAASAPTPVAPASSPAPSASAPSNTADERLKASPLAKKLAEEKGIDLSMVAGSGENGRIVRRDIESYTPATATTGVTAVGTAFTGAEGYDEIAVSQMRKTIAARLSESKFSAPHFYLTMEIGMDKAVAAREQMNAISEVKISMNDLVVKAAASALRKHPKVNSSWLGTKIRYNHHIHIGVAMAVEEGLLVPVVRFADQKSLSQISSEVKDFGKRAKEKKLQPQDWAGNTFTISNLGMFGIEEFTAIINPPDACIMAVGAVKDTVGVVNGEIKPVKTMKVTLSCDHRAVDGAIGAAFLNTFKEYLEEPVKMLV